MYLYKFVWLCVEKSKPIFYFATCFEMIFSDCLILLSALLLPLSLTLLYDVDSTAELDKNKNSNLHNIKFYAKFTKKLIL